MPVDIEIRNIAVQAFADQVCHVPERQDVEAAKHRNAVFKAEALASFYFFENRPYAPVFDDRLSGGCEKRAHWCLKISAAQKTKNSRLTYPFTVKNAAFTRDRSFGFTSPCS